MEQNCFNSQATQVIHKYADVVLLALIAVLAWWGSTVDSKVTAVAQEQARRTSRVEEVIGIRNDLVSLKIQLSDYKSLEATLKRHEEILRRLEDKLNSLFERGTHF